MPKTTAKRRGLYIPKPLLRTQATEGGSRTVRRGLQVDYEGGDDSDSEGSYQPPNDDMCEEEEVTGLEEEDPLLLQTLEYVDDGYVPYDEPVGNDGDEGA